MSPLQHKAGFLLCWPLLLLVMEPIRQIIKLKDHQIADPN
jgi:hypothetical protein